ncbi:hypothetical protein O7632_29335 [Solwaraspora sp. WMMD406]|uniref:hypothetical protein n=1 Tax=Solwaraspora sp. WMMD406 TaxID=3016095 RepID=UPI002416E825|nr:hypothetical protein [Solwaraspora sp. WMMD406]MDG4768162.1 hypothetical protein [Solwaraspora sp. WMMD406]
MPVDAPHQHLREVCRVVAAHVAIPTDRAGDGTHPTEPGARAIHPAGSPRARMEDAQ